MALESVAVDARDSPGSSAPDNEAAKRINSSSEENMPFMDSEGKFGKRYKVGASTQHPHVVYCGTFGQHTMQLGVSVGASQCFLRCSWCNDAQCFVLVCAGAQGRQRH